MSRTRQQIAGLLLAWALIATLVSLPAHQAGAQTANTLGPMTAFEADEGGVFTVRSGQAAVRVIFYTPDRFRIWLAPNGTFTDPANTPPTNPNQPSANIVVADDEPLTTVAHVDEGDYLRLSTDAATLRIYKSPVRFALYSPDDTTVIWAETQPLQWSGSQTTQRLTRGPQEQFFGGGMQNGRFSHRGQTVQISRNFNWNDGGRPSAAPFYMSTAGYGVFRNTFATGSYAFQDPVATTHGEQRFDAYYFVGDLKQVLDGYTHVTGRPLMPPVYGLEFGDADCYNHSNPSYTGGNHPDKQTTLAGSLHVADQYVEHDMPRGWMLVNDGYSCGYSDLVEVGQALEERHISLGLWTESDLTNQPFEVGEAGVRVRKTDVAWVGSGYRFALTACEDAYGGVESHSDARGWVWTVSGWAGTQRCGLQWTGDQSGSWENIRFHIPTIHGTGLSGIPWVGSDVDGIFGGGHDTYVRDLQWKVFSPAVMAMSGWAPFDKQPWRYGEPGTSINRDYLRLRERLLPYFYTYAAEAHRTGTPVARSMVLEYPDDPTTWGSDVQYQFLAGESFLVAPVYTDTTVRDGIYLPEGVWVDYWTGKTYEGPQTLDGYDAPLERLPLLVRAGAIVPMWPEGVNNYREVAPDAPLTLDIYPYGESEFTLYEDDLVTRAHAEGAFAEQTFSVSAPETDRGDVAVTIGPSVGEHDRKVDARGYELLVHSRLAPALVQRGTGPMATLPRFTSAAAYDAASQGWYYDAEHAGGVVRIKTGSVPTSSSARISLRAATSVDGQHPEDQEVDLSVAAPGILVPGGTAEVSATLRNDTQVDLRGIDVTLSLPQGWTAQRTDAGPTLLEPGAELTATFEVSVPAGASPGVARIEATARYTARNTTYRERRGVTVRVPYASLAAALNKVAITNDDDVGPGNFDGGGNSYSAWALAAAGATPGATITFNGVDFAWPDAQPGEPNAVQTLGQTIALQGRGSEVAFLGAEAGFVQSPVTVHYADGTTTTANLGFPNWCCASQTEYGAQLAIATNYRNTQNGPANHGITYGVFYNTVSINPTRDVVAVTLPNAAAIHVFAIQLRMPSWPPAPTEDTYASDMEWISATNGWGPVERDTSNGESAAGDGNPITLNGVVYPKGLGVHANSDIQFHVGGHCTRFTSDIGIDDEIPDYGSVVFHVRADGETVYQSGVLRGGDPTVSIDVDVAGATLVNLVVTDAGDGLTGDHADWAGARFHCSG